MDKWLKKTKRMIEAPEDGGQTLEAHLAPDAKPALNCKKTDPRAKLPTRGTPGSGGLDLYASEAVDLWPGDIRQIKTDVAMEIPAGFCGLLMTRSSMGIKGVRVAAGANCIDSDYRSDVKVYLRNDGDYPYHINEGDRVAQLVIVPVLFIDPVWVDELTETERGGGGFGSTGR